eukprot:1516434-Rhodomonas_salina.1
MHMILRNTMYPGTGRYPGTGSLPVFNGDRRSEFLPGTPVPGYRVLANSEMNTRGYHYCMSAYVDLRDTISVPANFHQDVGFRLELQLVQVYPGSRVPVS